MKKTNFVQKAAAFALAVGALSGCGRASDNLSAGANVAGLGSGCPVGTMATAWGCQPNYLGGGGTGWSGSYGCPAPYQPIGSGDICKATLRGSYSVGSLNLFSSTNTYMLDLGRYYLDGDKIEVGTSGMNGDFSVTMYAGSNSANVPNGSNIGLNVTGVGTNPTGYMAQAYVQVRQSSGSLTLRSGTINAKATMCRQRQTGQSVACPL